MTKRASRLLRPVTSGGTKSLVLMQARVRFDVGPLAVVEARFTADEVAEVDELEPVGSVLLVEGDCDSAKPSEDVGDVGGGVGREFRAGKGRGWLRSGRKLKPKSKSVPGGRQGAPTRVTGVTSARKFIWRSISYSDSDDDVDDGDADGNTIDAGDDDSEEIGDTGEMGYWGNPLAR